jgi:hypothetical protein
MVMNIVIELNHHGPSFGLAACSSAPLRVRLPMVSS